MLLKLATLLFVSALSTAQAGTIIQCKALNQPNVTITLDARRALGKMVNCISGAFISDMTPCAPTGGYGLSAPTGSAALVKLGDRWQDRMGHVGGMVESQILDDKIAFAGYWINSNENENLWMFAVNRLDGQGVLVQPGKENIKYICARVQQRL